MRKLLVIPIVHNAADLGRLEHRLEQLKRATMPRERIEASRKQVVRFWEELRVAIEAWQLDFAKVVVYQDALPFAPATHVGLEIKIVKELAAVGSANHQLLEWMHEHGARILGTESPELLVAEYSLVRKQLGLSNNPSLSQATPRSLKITAETNCETTCETTDETTDEATEIAAQLADLLNRRDQFIAARIDTTLEQDQTGIILIGMLHSVEKWLPDDIEVDFPIGQPKPTIVGQASNLSAATS